MILSIRHKGLKKLYEQDDSRGVSSEHAPKLRDILARLEAATAPTDLDLPGFRLHPLKGELKGFWVAQTGGSFFDLPTKTQPTLTT